MKSIKFFVIPLAALLSACVTTPTSSVKQHSLSVTPTQQARLNAALLQSRGDQNIDAAITEAADVISKYVATESCINDHTDNSLDLYTAPGGRMNTSSVPMMAMSYHDKSTCVSVERFQGWTMPAKNALQFEVIYISDNSGEVRKRWLEAVKQGNGSWLFTPY